MNMSSVIVVKGYYNLLQLLFSPVYVSQGKAFSCYLHGNNHILLIISSILILQRFITCRCLFTVANTRAFQDKYSLSPESCVFLFWCLDSKSHSWLISLYQRLLSGTKYPLRRKVLFHPVSLWSPIPKAAASSYQDWLEEVYGLP